MRVSLLPPSTQKPFKIMSAGDSGLGMFAAGEYQRGEMILREMPLLLYPQVIPFHGERLPGEEYPEIEDALSHLSPSQRQEFFSLMNSRPPERSRIKGIIDTNALFVGPLPGREDDYAAVCKTLSRVNHRQACLPSFSPLL